MGLDKKAVHLEIDKVLKLNPGISSNPKNPTNIIINVGDIKIQATMFNHEGIINIGRMHGIK